MSFAPGWRGTNVIMREHEAQFPNLKTNKMALIRQVRCHENSRMWAYVEWSDEDSNHFTILGGKEFPTKEEAEDYAKGFAIDSYEWVEPAELKTKRLTTEKEKLQKRLAEIDAELS